MALSIYGGKLFSTCSKRQYMAILLDDRHRVVGIGYNGGPSGMTHCDKGGCPRIVANVASGSNYDNCISIHAEQNAFLNASADAKTLIINGPPCFTCAKLIVNSTVEELHYLADPAYLDNERVQGFMRTNSIAITSHEMELYGGK